MDRMKGASWTHYVLSIAQLKRDDAHGCQFEEFHAHQKYLAFDVTNFSERASGTQVTHPPIDITPTFLTS